MLTRGIHPPENIQNGGRSGGECLSGTWRVHFDDESLRGGGYVFFLLNRLSVLSPFCDQV